MTAVSLAAGLARNGRRVLCIDSDSQGSLSVSLGVATPDKLTVTLATALMNVVNEQDYDPLTGVVHHSEGIDLMPANSNLAALSDDDAFLLNRVIERFKTLLVHLYNEHKNNAPYDEQTDVIKVLSENVDGYIKSKEKPRAKLNFLAKQIGLNTKHLSEDELKILMKALQKSDKYRNFRGKRK